MTDWISVEDRLPEIGEYCLVACARSWVGFCRLQKDDPPTWADQETDGCNRRHTYMDLITHWMPLPDPPGEMLK